MKNFTRWIPLATYRSGGDEYIVLARTNKKSGMMYFRVKKLNALFNLSQGQIGLSKCIDIKEQWKIICTEGNKP